MPLWRKVKKMVKEKYCHRHSDFISNRNVYISHTMCHKQSIIIIIVAINLTDAFIHIYHIIDNSTGDFI